MSASEDGMEEFEVEIFVPPNLGQDIRLTFNYTACVSDMLDELHLFW